jgi:hypothetical protein
MTHTLDPSKDSSAQQVAAFTLFFVLIAFLYDSL